MICCVATSSDTAFYLHQEIEAGRRILFEGAQGDAPRRRPRDVSVRDVVSNTVAGAGGAAVGVGRERIHSVIGIAKAYTTRVGNGPFRPKLVGAGGDASARAGTSSAPRPAAPSHRPAGFGGARYAARVNGLNGVAVTKLDVLTGLSRLKVCTRYKAGRRVLDEFPLLQKDFHHARPLYEELPGWTEDIRDCETWQDLPQAARDYVQYIAEFTKTRVKFIAVGPGRDETIVLPRSIGRAAAPYRHAPPGHPGGQRYAVAHAREAQTCEGGGLPSSTGREFAAEASTQEVRHDRPHP